jgi:hypothetical protein
MMNDDIDQWSGPEWVEFHEDYLGCLPSRVLNNLKTNKSMRQGFVNLWLHIATCLETGKVPNEPNVLDVCESYSRVGHWWRISEISTPEVVECFCLWATRPSGC